MIDELTNALLEDMEARLISFNPVSPQDCSEASLTFKLGNKLADSGPNEISVIPNGGHVYVVGNLSELIKHRDQFLGEVHSALRMPRELWEQTIRPKLDPDRIVDLTKMYNQEAA